MATIYCGLPKELIIGRSGKKREQEYVLGFGPNSPKFTIKWEDSGNGLIAKDVNEDVATMFLKRDGFSRVEEKAKLNTSVLPPLEKSVEPVAASSAPPAHATKRKRTEK